MEMSGLGRPLSAVWMEGMGLSGESEGVKSLSRYTWRGGSIRSVRRESEGVNSLRDNLVLHVGMGHSGRVKRLLS